LSDFNETIFPTDFPKNSAVSNIMEILHGYTVHQQYPALHGYTVHQQYPALHGYTVHQQYPALHGYTVHQQYPALYFLSTTHNAKKRRVIKTF